MRQVIKGGEKGHQHRTMARHPPRAQPAVFALVAFAVAALCGVRPARANGAFPDEFSIHFPSAAPHRLYLGANFGLLVSEDDGLTWRYSCEPWVVAGSNAALASANVSFYQVAADGALLADAVNITRSTDVACTWPAATGSVAGQAIDDIWADPNDANLVLAIIAFSGGSYLVASHDGGKTFDPGHLRDTSDLLTGIETARSKAGVFYATTVPTTSGEPAFLASTDSGATWTSTRIQIPKGTPLPSGTQPRILAVDPVDEKKVYLRLLNGATNSIALTADGGQTFATVLTINGQLSSFLRAGDGALYAGTMDGKIYLQPAGATTFTSHAAPHLRCLGQRPGTTRIYACADTVLDGYSLATSDDNGATFQPLMSFTQLKGPLTCAPVQTNCQAHWERIQGVLGIAPADAGIGDAGSPAPAASPGSHCSSAGADWWCLLAMAAGMSKRRRAR